MLALGNLQQQQGIIKGQDFNYREKISVETPEFQRF
jgi:hypothetical protein